MERTARIFMITTALTVFIGLPLLLYALGDTPRRSVLKEAISLLTLMAFTMMLGQYFLARSNILLLSLFKPLQIQKFHKYIAYSAVTVILLHPVLIVLPRYFEGGVTPLDAFVTMITEVDNIGILLGIAAWLLLLILVLTAYFRRPLIKRFTNHYRGWRHFHGALVVSFTVLALWHSIALGRHTDVVMSAFLITLAIAGFALLARLYWGEHANVPDSESVTNGAST